MGVLSKYIQTIAKTDNKGMEAIMPPIKELRLEISEITTINIAEIKTFKK